MIVVNFKIYQETFKEGFLKLTKICQKVVKETGVKIVVVASPLHVDRIYRETGEKPMVSHVDAFFEGRHTGAISPLACQELGVRGSLLNHSEKPLKLGTLASTLAILPEGFESIVCISSLGQTERFLKRIRPTYLAYEPKYLIANKEKSVASERLEALKKVVEIASGRGVRVLAGAGVKSRKDIEAVLSVGGKGVLLSSEVVLSSNPEGVLLDLTKAFKV